MRILLAERCPESPLLRLRPGASAAIISAFSLLGTLDFPKEGPRRGWWLLGAVCSVCSVPHSAVCLESQWRTVAMKAVLLGRCAGQGRGGARCRRLSGLGDRGAVDTVPRDKLVRAGTGGALGFGEAFV